MNMEFRMAAKPSFAQNRAWEKMWVPKVLRLLRGTQFLELSTEQQDCCENSDLVVLRGGDIRVAVRIRRPEFFDKYKNEMTIRCRLASGAKTEYQKILDGWGDLFFYGFANPAYAWVPNLRRWTLVSLAVFRELSASRMLSLDGPIANGDGTEFYAINITHAVKANPLFVVDSNWGIHEH